MHVIRVYPYLFKLYLIALFNFLTYLNEAMLAVFVPKYRSPILNWRYEMVMNLICAILILLDRSHTLVLYIKR